MALLLFSPSASISRPAVIPRQAVSGHLAGPAWRLFGIAGMGVSRRRTPSTNKSDRLRGPQLGVGGSHFSLTRGRVKSSEPLIPRPPPTSRADFFPAGEKLTFSKWAKPRLGAACSGAFADYVLKPDVKKLASDVNG